MAGRITKNELNQSLKNEIESKASQLDLEGLAENQEEFDSQLAQIAEDLDEKATTTTLSTAITTTWTGTTAPYAQIIVVTGIQETDNPIVDIDLSSISLFTEQEQILDNWAKVFRITTQENQITVKATEVTDIAIPIQLKVVR